MICERATARKGRAERAQIRGQLKRSSLLPSVVLLRLRKTDLGASVGNADLAAGVSLLGELTSEEPEVGREGEGVSSMPSLQSRDPCDASDGLRARKRNSLVDLGLEDTVRDELPLLGDLGGGGGHRAFWWWTVGKREREGGS